MAKKNALDWIAIVLVIIGGLNWGLVAVLQWDLVEALLGSVPVLQRSVYGLVGLAAIYEIYVLAAK